MSQQTNQCHFVHHFHNLRLIHSNVFRMLHDQLDEYLPDPTFRGCTDHSDGSVQQSKFNNTRETLIEQKLI